MTNQVTLFRSTKLVSTPYIMDVLMVLNRIKTGNSKKSIDKIRAIKDKAVADKMKLDELPVCCFNGTFSRRANEGLIAHSGLCILDFDKIPADKIPIIRDVITKIDYTFACWLSPSGKGLKALFRIPTDPASHRLYFEAITDFLNIEYQDKAGSYVSAACYESYDPGIYINEDAIIWVDKAIPDIEDVGTNQPILPVTSENRIIDNLLTWWRSKYSMKKDGRNTSLFKLAVAFNDFGIHKLEAERVLLSFEEKDFKEKEIKLILNSAYKQTHNFGTKFFEDQQAKTGIEKLVRSGKKTKDIIQEFPNIQPDVISKSIELVKEDMAILDFWEYSSTGKIKVVPHKLKFWLEQNNYFKYFPTKSSTYTFIHKHQNLLDETSDKRIKDFVLNYLMTRSDIGFGPYDYMASTTKFFNADFLSLIDTAQVEAKEDTQTECFIYFKNCVVKVTANEITPIEYVDIDGFIWRRQIIDRDFEKADHHDSEFRTFLWKVSGEDKQRYDSLKSAIGYLLHSYKTSANNKAIILNDETISENPNGGSGKGLFWNALSFMKRIASIDGKTFEFTKSFPYQTVSTDTQVLVFDDVKKNFNFESLFSLITEGITLEYKGQDAIKLPIQQSPKILITTNYTIGGQGGSFDRRKFEIELSGYFNSKYTPLDEFKHLLFDDWTDKEWNRFFSYMLNCSQYYLQNGLQTYDHKNLPTRKYIKATCHEFYEWASDETLPFNNRLIKKDVYNKYMDEHPDQRKWVSTTRFNRWLNEYANFNRIPIETGRSHNGPWVELTNLNLPKSENDEQSSGLPF